jgi:nitrogen regulatory protein PII
MQTVKRLEIVTLSIQAERLARDLVKAGAPGYTIIPHVQGSGHRGHRGADELTGVSENCVILISCPEDVVASLTKVIRPALRDFGGMCLLSDALEIKH